MSIARFLTTPCIVRTPDGSDSLVDGDGIPSVAVAVEATSCHLQPYRSPGAPEEVLGREQAVDARRAWFAAGTFISHASSVEVDGAVFSVLGDPASWLLGSSNDHIEVVLVRSSVLNAKGSS